MHRISTGGRQTKTPPEGARGSEAVARDTGASHRQTGRNGRCPGPLRPGRVPTVRQNLLLYTWFRPGSTRFAPRVVDSRACWMRYELPFRRVCMRRPRVTMEILSELIWWPSRPEMILPRGSTVLHGRTLRGGRGPAGGAACPDGPRTARRGPPGPRSKMVQLRAGVRCKTDRWSPQMGVLGLRPGQGMPEMPSSGLRRSTSAHAARRGVTKMDGSPGDVRSVGLGTRACRWRLFLGSRACRAPLPGSAPARRAATRLNLACATWAETRKTVVWSARSRRAGQERCGTPGLPVEYSGIASGLIGPRWTRRRGHLVLIESVTRFLARER